MDNIDKKSAFYIKFDWMFSELHLSDTSCDVFALIFSFTRNNKLTYYGTLQYLAKRINKSEKSISRALKCLVDADFVEKTIVKYNGITRPTYKVKDNILEQYKDDLKFLEELSENEFDTDKMSVEQDKMSDTSDKMSSRVEEITEISEGSLPDKMSIYSKYNNNYNFLSKSNKLDLSKKLVHSEECTCSDNSNDYKVSDTDIPPVYEKIEENENSVRAPEPSAVEVEQEQSDVDKINSLKLFKSNNGKKGKQKKETEFVKCAKLINSNDKYSKKLKDLLYTYLKFRITRRGLTEDIWKQILSQLEEAVSDVPTKDEDKLNYLKEFIVNSSLCAQYNTFYPINDRKLSELLLSYNPASRGENVDQDGLPRQYHGPVDRSKLATNPDGTPMIF